ncbi:HAAS signaling domain-containing protein [Actinoplanes sp. NPDC051859]|uniref:HAAS signaling domain-containing protein n=1 Tax=Actinoplanes sp. NPDC051859 TaxID=3363909 RepID=UPI0037B728BD
MSSHDIVVAEYLRELEQRLHGLPVLQRRELLGDLAAHIETECSDRGVTTEAALLQVLERLGAPEVVAAAAYEEAGLPIPPAPEPGAAAVPGPSAAVAIPSTSSATGLTSTPVATRSSTVPVATGVGSAAVGTVTVAASARFAGRAERTAAIGNADFLAAHVPPVSAPIPPVSAPVPPVSASVLPPPDVQPKGRPGPFPPQGPFAVGTPAGSRQHVAGASSGTPSSRPHDPGFGPGQPGVDAATGFGWSHAGPRLDSVPPFVGGPPFPPPPPRSTDSTTWMRVVLGGAAVLAVIVILGCLGGALMLRSAESDAGPIVEQPAQPIATIFPAEPEPPAERADAERADAERAGQAETAERAQPTDRLDPLQPPTEEPPQPPALPQTP